MIRYFLILILIVSSQSGFADTKETYRQLSIFNEVYNRVKNQYVEELTDKELVEKALNGMLQALDPHSSYMNEEVFKEMQVETAGAFGGLGIEITTDKSFIKIVSPIDDTPAQKAGVQAGDYITHLDGVSVVDMTLKEAIDIMRGEVGSSITLTILRGAENPFDVEIKRDIIKVQSVKHRFIDNVGVLRISTFNEQTTPGLKKIIEELESSDNPPIGYVLDLRNNPGGLLTESVSVSDIFLEQGEIVSIRGREKKDVQVYSAKKGDLINGKPLIVLINEGSASASEIVAGALQDHHRAIIVGTKSFGKGSVQTIIPLSSDGAAMRLTTARYYTPSGRSIQSLGVSPDILVEQHIRSDEDPDEARNFQRFEADLENSLLNDSLTDDERKFLEDERKKQEETAKMRNDDYQLSYALDVLKGLATLSQ